MHLILTVLVPQMQEQSVAGKITSPQPRGDAVFCSFEQSDFGSLPIIETQISHRNEKDDVTVSDSGL